MDARRLVGKNIRRIRLERKFSQEALALKAGIARSYMSGLERGVRNPTVTVLARLAKVLGCTLCDLVTTSAKPTPKPLPRGRRV